MQFGVPLDECGPLVERLLTAVHDEELCDVAFDALSSMVSIRLWPRIIYYNGFRMKSILGLWHGVYKKDRWRVTDFERKISLSKRILMQLSSRDGAASALCKDVCYTVERKPPHTRALYISSFWLPG